MKLEHARETLRNAQTLSTWASQYGRYQIVTLGSIKGYVPYGEPSVDRDIAMQFAVGIPEWFRESPESPLGEDEAERAFVNLLDRLHAEIVVHSSTLEIRGAVPIEVTISDDAPLSRPRFREGQGEGRNTSFRGLALNCTPHARV